MTFYDFVSEGLIPVLSKIGVFGWVNIRVNKQQSCIKPSACCGCEHTDTLAVELLQAICHGCGGTHALQRSEICLLCAIRRGCGGTHTFWRAAIESFPCVLALSEVILLWSFTGTAPCFCFFWDRFWWKFQVICCFAANLRLFSFIYFIYCDKIYILKYQFWKTWYDIRKK